MHVFISSHTHIYICIKLYTNIDLFIENPVQYAVLNYPFRSTGKREPLDTEIASKHLLRLCGSVPPEQGQIQVHRLAVAFATWPRGPSLVASVR